MGALGLLGPIRLLEPPLEALTYHEVKMIVMQRLIKVAPSSDAENAAGKGIDLLGF